MNQKLNTLTSLIISVFFSFSMNQIVFADNLEQWKMNSEEICWSNNQQECIEICKKILNQEPNYVPSIYLIARAYRNLKDYDTALKWYGKGLELEPNNVKLISSRGSLYARTGKLDSASEAAQKAISVEPDAPEGYELMGRLSLDKNDFEIAKDNFEKAFIFAKKDFRKKNFKRLVSVCYSGMSTKANNVEEKLEYLMLSYKSSPDFWLPYADLSDFYTKSDTHGKAYEYAIKALKYNPPDEQVKVYQNRINELKYVIAKEYIESVVKNLNSPLHDDLINVDAELKKIVTETYIKLGDNNSNRSLSDFSWSPNEALNYYSAAIKFSPDSWEPYYKIAEFVLTEV